jgi:hypothetical protein
MPKIKVYDAPIGVTGAIQTQRATADAFGGGAGMVAAGKAMFKFGEELQERTEKKEDLQYKADRAAMEAEIDRRVSEAETNAPLGADGHVESVGGITDQVRAEWAERVPKRLDGVFNADVAGMKLSTQRQGIRFQAASAAKKRVSDAEQFMGNWSEMVTRTPEKIDAGRAAVTDYLSSFPKAEREILQPKLLDLIGDAAVAAKMSMAKNSGQAKSVLSDLTKDDYWSSRVAPNVYSQKVAAAREAVRQFEEKERAVDHMAIMETVDTAAQTGAPPPVWSAVAATVEPGNPKSLAMVKRKYDSAVVASKAVATVKSMSAFQRNAYYDTLMSRLQGADGKEFRDTLASMRAITPFVDRNYNQSRATAAMSAYASGGGELSITLEQFTATFGVDPKNASQREAAREAYTALKAEGDARNAMQTFRKDPDGLIALHKDTQAAYEASKDPREREMHSKTMSVMGQAYAEAMQLRMVENGEFMKDASKIDRGQMIRYLQQSFDSAVGGEKIEAGRELQAATSALQAVQKDLKDDSVTFIMKNNPVIKSKYEDVKTARERGGDARAETEEYVVALKAEALRQGVHPADINILPVAEAEALNKSLSETLTADTDVQKQLDILQSERTKWGDAWPDVQNQLTKMKHGMTWMQRYALKLSGNPQIARELIMANNRAKGNGMSQWVHATEAKTTEIKKAIKSEFKDFMNAVSPLHRSTDNMRELEETVLPTMTAYYVATDHNLNVSEAAKKAVDLIVRSQVEPVGTFHIPRNVIKNDADLTLIKHTAGRLKLPKFINQDIVLPAGTLSKDDFLETIRGNGEWRTAKGGIGIELTVNGKVIFVKDENDAPRPYIMTWDDLRASGEEYRQGISTMGRGL